MRIDATARALRWGGTTCSITGGQACCVDGTSRACGAKNGGCKGTPMNCHGQADCPKGTTCCQAASSIGSQCLASCNGEPPYCYGSGECGAGEGCFPLEADEEDVWACAPCG